MTAQKKRKGTVIIAADVNVWEHELATAQALAREGYTVTFIRKSTKEFHTSADIYIDGITWEIKSPISSKKKAIEKNLRQATKQSSNVVFDSRRMKNLPDHTIEKEVRTCAYKRIRKIAHLIYINKHGVAISIK